MKSIYFIIIFGFTFLTSCSKEKENINAFNESDHRLYMKELTTGYNINSKMYPEKKIKIDNNIYFDYSYFGLDKSFNAEINEDDIVISLEVTIDENMVGLRSAIEEKLTLQNGRLIKFACEKKEINQQPINWQETKCILKSKKQNFESLEYELLTKKPENVSVVDWSYVKRLNSFRLYEEIDLSEATKNKIKAEKDKELKEIENKVNRANKDI